MSDVVKLIPTVATLAGSYFLGPAGGALIGGLFSYQAGRYQQRKAERAARDAYNASLQNRLVTTASTDGRRSRIYGRARNCDGIVFKGTWGPNSQYYTLVIALAGHECDAIEDVYINDQKLTLASDGAGGFWVQDQPYNRQPVISAQGTMANVAGAASITLPGPPVGTPRILGVMSVDNVPVEYSPVVVGNLVTATVDPADTVTCYYQYTGSQPKARIWKYLGATGQDLSTLLASRFPALITSADKFQGMCCLVVELEFDQDAFQGGPPQVSAVVRGAKVLDPRTGITAWTQNPSLIARDWSLYQFGGGCLAGEVNEARFTAAANACDIVTSFTTPSGAVVAPLYQCNIVCPLDAQPTQTLDEIVESMAGKWAWAGGQMSVVAGVYRAPVATITEDWVSDATSITIVPQQSRADLVNVYRPTICDAAQNYVAAPMPEVRSAAYIAADGQELPRELQLGGVTDNVHAQHVCGVFMRDARDGLTLKLPCKFNAWPLELFDVVAVTLPVFGFNAKLFEILGWQFSIDQGVILTLKETAASIFDPAANFNNPNAAVNSSLVQPWVVPTVSGLAVDSSAAALPDGTQQTRAIVSWAAVGAANVSQSGKIEVQYFEAFAGMPAADWPGETFEGSATSAIITGLKAGGTYLFRVRAKNTIGVRSNWSNHVLHRIAAAQAIGGNNLLANSSFEVDSNADGLADGWTAYSAGTTGAITRSIPSVGLFGAKVQRISAAGLGATSADQIGITQTQSVFGAAGQPFVLSAYVVGGTGSPKAVIQVEWRDALNVLVGVNASGEFAPGTTILARHFVKGTIPGAAVSAVVTLWGSSRTGGAGAAAIDFDAVQLEIGSVMSGYSPRADEILAGTVGTGQIAPNAATEIIQDTNDFAGASFGTGTQRTVSFTPTVDSVIEFTASCGASSVLPDSGNRLEWYVSFGGGADTLIAACDSNSGTRQTFVGATSFLATGGVSADVKLVTTKNISNPSILLFRSSIRLGVIKR